MEVKIIEEKVLNGAMTVRRIFVGEKGDSCRLSFTITYYSDGVKIERCDGLGLTATYHSDGEKVERYIRRLGEHTNICVVQENVGNMEKLIIAKKGAITLDDLAFSELMKKMVDEAIAIIHEREDLMKKTVALQQEEIGFNISFSKTIERLTMQPIPAPA